MKKVIRLTESDLVRLVKKVINEQQINFKVVGKKNENFREMEYGRPPVYILLMIKDAGSGEVFLEVEEEGNEFPNRTGMGIAAKKLWCFFLINILFSTGVNP